ncbi:MAG: MipA/OmpV family protein [Bacillota bacterium]
MRHALARALLVLTTVMPAFAWAADDSQQNRAAQDPQEQLSQAAATEGGSGWIVGGGVAATDPGYVGYNRQYTPIPLIFYHNGRFFFAGINVGYMLFNGDHYRFSLLAEPTFNRLKASDSPELTGIQSRQWSIAGGVNLELFGDWGRLRTSLEHDLLDRNNGTSVNLGYQYSFDVGGGWSLTPGFGLRWQNANLVNYYYGVSPAEAIPGRPAYSPSSATNPYVSLGLSTSLNEHWQFRSFLQYMRFGSAIHDSPIVDRSGSPAIFIGFTYNPR